MSVQTRTTALQNEVVRLYCQFEYNGVLTNPVAQPLVEIIDTDGVTILDTVIAQQEHYGIAYADWYVPANLPLGSYYDRWTFQWSPSSSVTEMTMTFTVYGLESYINFISPAISINISNRAVQLMKDLSNDFIYEAMHIPVYWEQAMRIQQENQAKRIKQYYYFTLDADKYDVDQGAVYFNNGQKFTVWEMMRPYYSSSSSTESTSSSDSIGNISTSSSSSSSSSGDSNSSVSSTSSGSSSSSSADSLSSSSSSSSSGAIVTTTTTTTPWQYQPILTCVGTGAPTASGMLTKISGNGPTTINFVSYTVKTSRFSTIYSLAYNNWNKDPRPIARLNNRIVDDGWFVDWNGRIYFDGLMAPEDSVNVTYNFAYFKDEEILSFLNLGLQIMNSQPPASIYYSSLDTMPGEWNAPVILYAAITALKRLIFGLNFQEKMIIFGEPDQARQAISTFQQLYQDYSTLWAETAKNAKTRKLYGMSQYVTPEYTLPGGRCMASDTFINCKVNEGSRQNLTIEEIFNLFEMNNNIRVLSLKKNGKLDYISVGKVWKSGRKKTYVLKTNNAQIRLSKEHLVYIPRENNYKPVMDLTVNDSIYILKGKKMIEQKLLSIPEEYKVEDVFDIEVPETENFIGNNVVSHNSRWFRYLYK
jgi:hypothetical protein